MSRSIPSLLPNIRTLFLDIETPGQLHRNVIFLLPTLTRLTVTLHGMTGPEVAYLVEEFRRASSLKQLQLFGCLTAPDAVTALRKALKHLKRLETVSLDVSHETFLQAFRALPSIPSLEVLSIRQGEQPSHVSGPPAAAPIEEEKARFLQLKRLLIGGYRASLASYMMSSFRFPSLHELDMSLPSHNLQHIHGFFTALEQGCPDLGILNLTFDQYLLTSTNALTINAIHPVCALHRLQSLRISHPYPISCSQGELSQFVMALPDIEVLILNPNPTQGRETPPSLTLSALLPIARHCCHLRHLGLYLDATQSIPQPSESFSKSLVEVTFGSSPILDFSSVATTLLSMGCPRIHRNGAPKSGSQNIWSAVQIVLEEVRRVGASEKAKLDEKIAELTLENIKLRTEIGHLVSSKT